VALAQAALWDFCSGQPATGQACRRFSPHTTKKLDIWAGEFVRNEISRTALRWWGAEIARIGRPRMLTRMRLYERAIRSARSKRAFRPQRGDSPMSALSAFYRARRPFDQFRRALLAQRPGLLSPAGAPTAKGEASSNSFHPHLRGRTGPCISHHHHWRAPPKAAGCRNGGSRPAQAVSGEIRTQQAHRDACCGIAGRACRGRAWPAHPCFQGDEPRIAAEKATTGPRPA